MSKCKSCGSTQPHLHPAVQSGGEVHICRDEFHLSKTPQNKPEYIAAVLARRREAAPRGAT